MVETGQLMPGDRAPTVEQLKAEHGISDDTAMQVFRQLDRWGLIVRRKRRGAWVRGRPPYRMLTSARFDRAVRNAGPSSSYDQEWAESGYATRIEYLTIGWGEADLVDAADLGLPTGEGDPIVVRSRRQWATPLGRDGQPVEAATEVVQLMRSVFPKWVADRVPDLLAPSTGRGGAYSRIDERLGLVDCAVEAVIPSRHATSVEAELFEFERVTPVMQITRTGYHGGRRGEIVEVARCVMLPQSTGLEYEIEIKD